MFAANVTGGPLLPHAERDSNTHAITPTSAAGSLAAYSRIHISTPVLAY